MIRQFKAGDTPTIRAQLAQQVNVDEDGEPGYEGIELDEVNLQDATVSVYIRHDPSGSIVAAGDEAEVVDVKEGHVEYTMAPTQTAAPGEYTIEFVAKWPADHAERPGEIKTWPTEGYETVEATDSINRDASLDILEIDVQFDHVDANSMSLGAIDDVESTVSTNQSNIGNLQNRTSRLSGDGTSADLESLSTGQIGNTHRVETETELRDDIGSFVHLQLADDITLDSPINQDIGSTDLRLDLNGHTITKDYTDDHTFHITTTGRAVIENGTFELDAGAEIGGVLFEIAVFGASACRYEDLCVIDNTHFALGARDCGLFYSSGCEIATSIKGSSQGGNDGIHPFDCDRVIINNYDITTSDDCISIAAENSNINQIVVGGGTLASDHGGVKIQANVAGHGAEIGRVTLNGPTVEESGKQAAISIFAASTSSRLIDTVRIPDATSKQASQRGLTLTDIQDLQYDVTVADCSGDYAANVSNCGSAKGDVEASGLSTTGVRHINVDGGSIDATIDGEGSSGDGVELEEAPNHDVRGSIRDMGNNGISMFGASGSVTEGCVVSATVTGCANWGYTEPDGYADYNLVQGTFLDNSTGSTNTNANTVVGDTVSR